MGVVEAGINGEAIYNQRGRSIPQLLGDTKSDSSNVRGLSKLKLRNIYDSDSRSDNRREAGRALGYSGLRIALHEKKKRREGFQ